MSLPFNIAIDGYSSSGKSTLAKKLLENIICSILILELCIGQ